jgi:exodeoxyribonuclease VIII
MIELPDDGLIEDVPDDVYHSWAGASQSRLKSLGEKSPQHMMYGMTNPTDQTPAMKLGTAAHAAILQPVEFVKRYATTGQCVAKTKSKGTRCTYDGKQRIGGKWYCGRHAEDVDGDDLIALDRDDFHKCLAMRDAVHSHPTASVLLQSGLSELSAVWRDPEFGVRCKARIDHLAPDGSILVDIKTTYDASPEFFTRRIFTSGYYLQAAHYLTAVNVHDIPADLYAIVAVENEPPHAVVVYQLDEEAIDAGRKELRPLLKRWAECEANGSWPSYPDEAVNITLPPWAWKQIEGRL